MKKYRVLQVGENQYVVQRRFLRFFWLADYIPFDCLKSAEQHVFYRMWHAEKKQFVKRVVGDPGEYELRYLKQRIEEITK